ncbi:hypothetical protein [Pseudanabaena sp. FACHB-2040]|uniref:hypothetical protein n=1 Tax=Pseudanabaena sp. FACHB-2040 TaxID=2692859 RepID=UPI0016825A22|nr:hypothetical protein [Pseudanabaena sp. FACHB-2040]MBD2258495.1 hypothetical protein [Pseudanabaena sp. FACHB-2040]
MALLGWGKTVELAFMHPLPLLIGSTTLLGFGYFCFDLYRNRRRLSEKPEVDMVCYDVLPLDGADSSAVNHAVGEASQCIDGGLGHCVDAISHAFHQ